MPKEVLMYGEIYTSSVERFINAMNEVESDEEITLRINSNGGNPEDMAGMIDKFQSFKGTKKIKIDGKAYSSAFFFTLYADVKDIEATDISKALIHRAAYPDWVESNKDIMTQDRWDYLDATNKTLRTALEAKVSSEDFARVTGKTLDEVFSNDSRIDVFLDAKQMKKLGLIGKINTITPKKQAKIEASYFDVAARFQGVQLVEASQDDTETTDDKVVTHDEKSLITDSKSAITDETSEASKNTEAAKSKQIKSKYMTVDQLKAEHPELFASVHAMGVTTERDRVEAILVYHDVDAKKTVEIIKAHNQLTNTQREELTLKAATNKEVVAIADASAKAVTTAEIGSETTTKEVEVKAFSSNVFEKLGIKA